MSLSRTAARKLADEILGAASFGDVRVRIRATQTGHARFGASRPTTGGDVAAMQIEVTAAKDGRHATVTGNRTDGAAIVELVRTAERLAELSPVDPEYVGPLGPVKYPRVAEHDTRTAALKADARLDQVGRAIATANKEGLEISGFLEHEDETEVFADRAGLFGYRTATRVSMSCTCRTADGTGSAKRGYVSHAVAGLRGDSLASDAAAWALRSKNPVGMDPGRYTVVLAPQAVADLMHFFVGAMSQRRADEGRSWFSAPGGRTKVGEKLFSEKIRLWSDPRDKANPAASIASDGRPQEPVTWVEAGVLRALTVDRYWAVHKGLPSRPTPSSLHMAGSTDDLDALVAGVDRGILVSRFWYNRMLEPRSITVTGLTRDGTFLIEKGRIARPIKNLRYNDSPVTLLKNVQALGKPERAGLDTRRVMVVPPMVVSDFLFSSTSDAI